MNLEKTMESLRRRGFGVSHFETGAQAADYVAGQLHGCSVGMGGSMTLQALGLYERLEGEIGRAHV